MASGDVKMPRPVYVIFANSGSIDQTSNMVSIFDVIEIVNVFKKVSDSTSYLIPQKTNRITAVWMRETVDKVADKFQGQLACVDPENAELFVSEVIEFSFEFPFYRFASQVFLVGFNTLGTHLIEARLRRAGEEGWTWRQTFPFIVQEGILPSTIPTEAPPG